MRPRIRAERRLCALWRSTELAAGARQIGRLCLPRPGWLLGVSWRVGLSRAFRQFPSATRTSFVAPGSGEPGRACRDGRQPRPGMCAGRWRCRGRDLGRRRRPGLPPRFGRVGGRHMAAGQPVPVQRPDPARRAGALSGAAPLVSRMHSHMRTCSWWAIPTARIAVRTTSHRRPPAQAIMSRAAFRTRSPGERPWPGRCPGPAGPARVSRATGVRCGPPVVRCGYDSSLTSPGH